MGQKTNVNGWRRNNKFETTNKLSELVYNTGFKHKGDQALSGWSNYTDLSIVYSKHRNMFIMVENIVRDQLFVIRYMCGGINVMATKLGCHIELAVYDPDCLATIALSKKERRDVFISLMGSMLFNEYGIRTTWSIYDLNAEMDIRVIKSILRKVKYTEAKPNNVVESIKDMYTIKGRVGLIYITSYGNVTSRIADMIAGLLIRSSGHTTVIKGLNKLLDKYCTSYNGIGSRDDVQFGRKVFQGISIKIKGTIGGSRRTITVDMQRGKMSKSTISAAIITAYTQAKTTSGTRGVSVTIIY